MRISRIVSFLGATAWLLDGAALVHADYIAVDNAGNYVAGGGWNNSNNNQGSGTPGFTTPWAFNDSTPTGSTGLGTSAAMGTSWALQADDDGASYAFATRNFPSISVNDSIRLDLDASAVASDGYEGVYFGNGAAEVQLNIDPATAALSSNSFPSEDYFIIVGNQTIDTTLSANGTPVHFDLKLLSIDPITLHDTYAISLQQGSTIFTTTDSTSQPVSSSGQINSVNFIDFSTGSTPFYLNNLTVTPLPSAAIAACPLLAIVALRKLKRTNHGTRKPLFIPVPTS